MSNKVDLKILNSFFKNEVNKYFDTWLPNNELNHLSCYDGLDIQLYVKTGTGITTSDGKEGVFSLNSAIYPVQERPYYPQVHVVRAKIPHAKAEIACNGGSKSFNSIVGPVVKQMLDSIKNLNGFDPNKDMYTGIYATFERPGIQNKGMYFFETEMLEYELRLYSRCAKVIFHV